MNSCLRLWTCQTDTTPPSPPVSRYWPSRLRSTACERWSENFLFNSLLPSCTINYLPASSVKCPTKVKLKGFQLGSVSINCLWISRWSGGSLSLPSKQSSYREVERSDKKSQVSAAILRGFSAHRPRPATKMAPHSEARRFTRLICFSCKL